jgi:hypothetical protein
MSTDVQRNSLEATERWYLATVAYTEGQQNTLAVSEAGRLWVRRHLAALNKLP